MIPFNRPSLVGRELEYVADAVARGHLSGDGHYTKSCHSLLEEITGARKALLTTSCTHALEMAALLLDIGPGDEVIVPSFTFVSTANAFVLRGAEPVFVDIRSDTLNLDERLLQGAITPRTKAIVVVHYAGVACNMEAIQRIAERSGIPIVEDNAHGLFGSYRGRPLGSFGALATLSFHETKNVTCGEGGALLINDPRYIERAEIIREKGTDRSRFFRGQVDKYGWVDLGSSYLPSEINAGFLLAQLEGRDRIQANRALIWSSYRLELGSWAATNNVRLPVVPEECAHPAHLFYLLFDSLDRRQRFLAHARSRGVYAVFHYLPLDRSTFAARFARPAQPCRQAADASDRLVRLPLFGDLSPHELETVISATVSFDGSS